MYLLACSAFNQFATGAKWQAAPAESVGDLSRTDLTLLKARARASGNRTVPNLLKAIILSLTLELLFGRERTDATEIRCNETFPSILHCLATRFDPSVSVLCHFISRAYRYGTPAYFARRG